ncbi:MAG: LysR family transcriptional regulator, partial [Muribaculaceae bacterium]|nr:LysR family transcriptional regulator [Muribaculaceae bacterium]
IPWFIKKYTDSYPDVKLTVNEMKGDTVIDSLRLGKIDIGIAISGNNAPEVKEIPFYCEPFYVYVSKDCLLKMPKFNPADLLHEKMWIMKESQCMRESAFRFCTTRSIGRHIYEAGSVETLIRIVDINGGFTIIPEMHLSFLTDAQRENVRPIEGEYVSRRCVSIYISKDFIRHRMLKSMVEIMSSFIPRKMIDSGLLVTGTEERIKTDKIKNR